MKKLVLKKDVVARINGGEMNQLKGGGNERDLYTWSPEFCADKSRTVNTDPSCPGYQTCQVSCMPTCEYYCKTMINCGYM